MTLAARVSAAAVAVGCAVFLVPGTASADGPMQRVGGQGCWSAGGGRFSCDDYFSGGVAPFTGTGAATAGARVASIAFYDAGSSYEVSSWGYCYPGQWTSVQITVTDSIGQILRINNSFLCPSRYS